MKIAEPRPGSAWGQFQSVIRITRSYIGSARRRRSWLKPMRRADHQVVILVPRIVRPQVRRPDRQRPVGRAGHAGRGGRACPTSRCTPAGVAPSPSRLSARDDPAAPDGAGKAAAHETARPIGVTTRSAGFTADAPTSRPWWPDRPAFSAVWPTCSGTRSVTCKPAALHHRQLPRVVRHQPHGGKPHLPQDLGADAEIALVILEPQPVVRLDRVKALILQANRRASCWQGRSRALPG